MSESMLRLTSSPPSALMDMTSTNLRSKRIESAVYEQRCSHWQPVAEAVASTTTMISTLSRAKAAAVLYLEVLKLGPWPPE